MRYSSLTDASGPDVIAQAVSVFGPAGHGLRLTARDMLSARFESEAGHVALEASRTADSRTEVIIETREFDTEVRAFITALPRHSWLVRKFKARMKRRREPGR